MDSCIKFKPPPLIHPHTTNTICIYPLHPTRPTLIFPSLASYSFYDNPSFDAFKSWFGLFTISDFYLPSLFFHFLSFLSTQTPLSSFCSFFYSSSLSYFSLLLLSLVFNRPTHLKLSSSSSLFVALKERKGEEKHWNGWWKGLSHPTGITWRYHQQSDGFHERSPPFPLHVGHPFHVCRFSCTFPPFSALQNGFKTWPK